MKINISSDHFLIKKSDCKDLFKIMKICLLFLFAFTFQLMALNSNAQDAVIEIKNNSLTINQLINEIERQTDYLVVYSNREVDTNRRVNFQTRSGKVSSYLNEAFSNTEIGYDFENNYIVLSKKVHQNATTIAQLIQATQQQGRTITGRVTDENGEPVIGANIIEKGTTNGTVTDIDGSFSLQVEENAVLHVSYIGYLAQDIPTTGRTSFNILLEEDTKTLDELVVVGYGTMRKSDLTGAVTRVSIEQQSELANINILQSLQGTVPGLNIGAISTAGAEPSLSIRGQNTLSSSAADNKPLIVLDGIIYRGNLGDINASTIESIDILKDASSASVYGSQAANGVIIITSKKGARSGKPIINYSGQFSVQTPSKQLKPLQGADYETFLYDLYWMDGSYLGPDYIRNPDFSLAQRLKNSDIAQGYNDGLNNNWWDMFTGNGKVNSHNISVSGRGDNSGYFFSAGYTDQEAFVVNDLYKRYDVRANMDTKITDWLSFGFQSFVALSDYSGVHPWVGEIFTMQPYTPIRDSEGDYLLAPNDFEINPFLQLEVDDYDKRLNLFGNFHFDLKLPFLEGFNYRMNYSHNYRDQRQNQFHPYKGDAYQGEGYKRFHYDYYWTLDNIFSYNRNFGPDHRVDLTLLYGVEKGILRRSLIKARNFDDKTLGYHRLDLGEIVSITTENEQGNAIPAAEDESSLYGMARLFYSYKNRYMLTGTVRRDGFSGFGADNKIGTFPSLAAAWNISEEDFFKIDIVDFLKLRGSYGTTARRAVNRYQTLARVTSVPNQIIFGDGGSPTNSFYISSMANSNLGWETTTGLNVGVDFQMLGSRLGGNVEYYKNNTKNILYEIQIPNMTGFEKNSTNIGKVKNHGYEFELWGVPVKTKDFSWNVSVNFSAYRNRIVSILGLDLDGDGKEDDLIENGLFIGQPREVIYDYQIDGMWQLEDQAAGRIPTGFYPGTYRIADLYQAEGDTEYRITPDDRTILGYKDPAYRFGISNTLKYKDFSLYVFVNSIQGGKDYYMDSESLYASSLYNNKGNLGYRNVPAFDYWTPVNRDARYRRPDQAAAYDPKPYRQRNFIRLQDVSLSYQFKKEWIQRFNIQNLRVNISGKNLVTLTKWEGWDPELGTGLAPNTPLMKSYTVGLNIEF